MKSKRNEEITSEVRALYDKIETIKKSINFSNGGDKPEIWIQRQNLQDLYQQIIIKYLSISLSFLFFFLFMSRLIHKPI